MSSGAKAHDAGTEEFDEADTPSTHMNGSAKTPAGSVTDKKSSLIQNNEYFKKTGDDLFPGIDTLSNVFADGLLESGYVRLRKDGKFAAAEYKIESSDADKYNRSKVYDSAELAKAPFGDRFNTRNKVRKVTINDEMCYEMEMPVGPALVDADRATLCTVLIDLDMLENVRKRHWEMRVRDERSPPYACCTHEVLPCGVPQACAIQRLTTYLGLVRPTNSETEWSWRDMRLKPDKATNAMYMDRAIRSQASASASSDAKSKEIMESLERRRRKAEERMKRTEDARSATKTLEKQHLLTEQSKIDMKTYVDASATRILKEFARVVSAMEMKMNALVDKLDEVDDKIESAFSALEESANATRETVKKAVSPPLSPEKKRKSDDKDEDEKPKKKKKKAAETKKKNK